MTNEVLNVLENRRSCREYRNEQIKDEELRTVLDAGLWAPTAMGTQDVIMIAVQDRKTIEKLSCLNAAVMNSSSDPFYGAPTVVVVLARPSANDMVDGSGVMNYLMLAASSIGLGSCWINRAKEVFKEEEGKKLLKEWGVEGDWIGVGNCILGYPVETAPKKPRKDGRVFYVR